MEGLLRNYDGFNNDSAKPPQIITAVKASVKASLQSLYVDFMGPYGPSGVRVQIRLHVVPFYCREHAQLLPLPMPLRHRYKTSIDPSGSYR